VTTYNCPKLLTAMSLSKITTAIGAHFSAEKIPTDCGLVWVRMVGAPDSLETLIGEVDIMPSLILKD
jgi:hypothetical protein